MNIADRHEDYFNEDFYFAASIGDVDTIRDIFKTGDFTGVNTVNPSNGNTPLIIACAFGLDARGDIAVFQFSEVIELLVENGADINAINYRGRSALYMAASWGHWDVVEYLLEKGAHVGDNETERQEILNVTSYITPRRCQNAERAQVYYNNHSVLYKHHGLKMAKSLMKDVSKVEQFSELLTDIEEDNDKINSYAEGDPEEDIPDDIMDIIVYYNHFATLVVLIQHMEPDEVPLMESNLFLEFVGRLGEQRNNFNNVQQQ